MNKKILILSLLGLLSAIVFYGCCPDELDGTLKENIAPTMGITNIDYYDSVFTFNAVVTWFGIDQDGRVVNYYYKPVLSSVIGSTGPYEADTVTGNSIAEAYIDSVLSGLAITEWTLTDETEATIEMLAGESETDTLYQYIFFRCEDNDGAYSDIRFYPMYRVNRLPETTLNLLPGQSVSSSNDTTVIPVWCLPDTTALWEGLSFSWSGEDTLDFPDGSPDFEYSWQIYGPYDAALYDTSTNLIDLDYSDIASDSLLIKSCDDVSAGYIRVDEGVECENEWVWDLSTTLTDLSGGTYIFVVTTRDDALVPDQTPAWSTFVVVEPEWVSNPDEVKDIIIIQSTQYMSSAVRGRPTVYVDIDDSTTAYFPGMLMDFYREMLDSAGYSESNDFVIYGDTAMNNGPTDFPSMYDLAQYRMVIIDDLDYHWAEYQTTDESGTLLANYLSVGGKVWMIGRQCFLYTWNSQGYYDADVNSLASDYFDLTGFYYTNYNMSTDSAEFIGATSLISDFGSYLAIDPVKTQYLRQHGINKVEVMVRGSGNSSTLFTYDAANPDTMEDFQYMPCAVQYEQVDGVFKTSYFSFPLYLMDNSNGQVTEIFRYMLNWFLEEE